MPTLGWWLAAAGISLVAAAFAWIAASWRSAVRLSDVQRAHADAAARLDEQATARADAERALTDERERRLAAEREVTRLAAECDAERRNVAEQRRLLGDAEAKLREAFQAIGSKTLEGIQAQFLEAAKAQLEAQMLGQREAASAEGDARRAGLEAMLAPLRAALDEHKRATSALELKREEAYAAMHAQLMQIAGSHRELKDETGRLVSALRRPEGRGRWGELGLRNVVETAGMTAHVDFVEQVSSDTDEGRLRPDMIVRLPGGGEIVVDAKVVLDAYLNALEPNADRETALAQHVRQMHERVRDLESKRYRERLRTQPKVVVMFVRVESALTAALERDPGLVERAMEKDILIATPILLVALLRAVAYGWQQEAIGENAKAISAAGAELYSRVATFIGHLERVGKGLLTATQGYNSAIGSLERQVLPSARRMRELRATDAPEIESPPRVEIETRRLTPNDLWTQESPAPPSRAAE